MDGMTDYQYESIIKMVIEILNGSDTIEDAQEKLEKLLKNKSL